MCLAFEGVRRQVFSQFWAMQMRTTTHARRHHTSLAPPSSRCVLGRRRRWRCSWGAEKRVLLRGMGYESKRFFLRQPGQEKNQRRRRMWTMKKIAGDDDSLECTIAGPLWKRNFPAGRTGRRTAGALRCGLDCWHWNKKKPWPMNSSAACPSPSRWDKIARHTRTHFAGAIDLRPRRISWLDLHRPWMERVGQLLVCSFCSRGSSSSSSSSLSLDTIDYCYLSGLTVPGFFFTIVIICCW